MHSDRMLHYQEVRSVGSLGAMDDEVDSRDLLAVDARQRWSCINGRWLPSRKTGARRPAWETACAPCKTGVAQCVLLASSIFQIHAYSDRLACIPVMHTSTLSRSALWIMAAATCHSSFMSSFSILRALRPSPWSSQRSWARSPR